MAERDPEHRLGPPRGDPSRGRRSPGVPDDEVGVPPQPVDLVQRPLDHQLSVEAAGIVAGDRLVAHPGSIEGRHLGPLGELRRDRPLHLRELRAEQQAGPGHPTNLPHAGVDVRFLADRCPRVRWPGSLTKGMGMGTTGLVVEARPPIDNVIKAGHLTHATVRVIIGEGQGATLALGSPHRRDREHWLVPGMQAPVSVNPGNPQDFEVLWDQVPSMPDRVAAGDPALADPRAQSRPEAGRTGVPRNGAGAGRSRRARTRSS